MSNHDSVNAGGVTPSAAAILQRMSVEMHRAGAAGAEAWPTIRRAAAGLPSRPYRAIVLTGCGDSYYAALALRGLVEAASGVPTLAQPAMEVVGFPSILLNRDALLVAISVSGKVERTIEATTEHRRRGGATASITAYGDSDLALVADAQLPTGLRGTPGPVPGTASFLGSMLGIVAVAAELGQRSGTVAFGDADVVQATEGIGQMVGSQAELAQAEAAVLQPPFFALGSGPDLGAAWFGVAKFIEAAATVGVAQDLEEWAHEQYFTTGPHSTVFVHASTAAVRERARRVASSALKVGARLVTISAEPLGLPDEHNWPLPASLDALRPLISWVPMAMTAHAHATTAGRSPFGIDLPDRMKTVDEDIYLEEPSRA